MDPKKGFWVLGGSRCLYRERELHIVSTHFVPLGAIIPANERIDPPPPCPHYHAPQHTWPFEGAALDSPLDVGSEMSNQQLPDTSSLGSDSA